jgi:nitrate/TMAO reductase-like tetraheme cytochrome c subunit
MKKSYLKLLQTLTVVTVLCGGVISTAYADDDENEKPMAAANNAKWKAECGSCHIAFPPRLLPADSWHAMMSGLDKHFGSDASLDAASASEIGQFLEKNAGHNKHPSSDKPLLRITETRWFIHEHREVTDRTWKNPKIKSAANCTACHTQADKGSYREREIHIPK